MMNGTLISVWLEHSLRAVRADARTYYMGRAVAGAASLDDSRSCSPA